MNERADALIRQKLCENAGVPISGNDQQVTDVAPLLPVSHKFHKTLGKHGFNHVRTIVKRNRFAGDRPEGIYTEHLYTHPQHGRSHVVVRQYHHGESSKRPSWIHRLEQSNGILAPSAGDTSPQLDRSLQQHAKA